MDKVKFGIIGFGFMGHTHEDTITNKVDNAEVVAICDIDPARMDDAITPNVQKFTDPDEFFAVKDMDVVVIVVPNHIHKEMVFKAARAGKHIICEKPAAMSVAEFDEMMEEVKKNNVTFTVHQQRRFDPDFRSMKAVYDDHALGDIFTIQSGIYGLNGNMHDWHVYKKYGGGMLYDWGVHLIDQMLFMVDSKVKTIFADLRNVINFEVDDYFKILLEFENGILGEIELGTYFLRDQPKWYERHWFMGGNKGSAYCDGFKPDGKIVRTTRLLESVPGKLTMSKTNPTRSFGFVPPGVLKVEDLEIPDTKHVMYYENYMKALAGEEEFLVKPEQVRRVLSLMEAVRTSAAEHRAIEFE